MKTQKQAAGGQKNPKAARDIYAMRKRKKRRKVLRQSIWMLLLAMTILILYQRRDSWLPQLETMGVRHQSHRQDGFGETDGNFPIYVIGGTDYQVGEAGGRLLLLSDSYLHIYEMDGALLAARQHTYGSAILQTKGDYALIYESGGTHFRLDTVAKTRLEKSVNDPIFFGRVSENGLIALVTGADTCACRLLIFNAKGQQIYERSCVEKMVDFAFHADEAGCYAVSIRAENGSLESVVHSYSFSQKEDLWESKPLDMLAISVYNTIEGNAFILGDTQSCYLDENGEVESSYLYPDAIVRGVCDGGTAALLLENNEKRTQSIVILDGNANAPLVRTFDSEINDIGLLPETGAVLVQFRNQFETIDYSGAVRQNIAVSDSYDGFLRIGQYLFLRGYDRIDRIEYYE